MAYTTNIPLARDLLGEVADHLDQLKHEDVANEIRSIISQHMIRRPKGRRGRNERATVTPEIRAGVERMLMETEMTQEQIAAHFKIDGGRVSEIYNNMKDV